MTTSNIELKETSSLLPWVGWLVACSAAFFQFLLQTSTSVMIPGLQKTFSLNSLGISLLSSSFFYIYLLCQLPAGLLIDRIKPRKTLFFGQLLLSSFCLLFANANTVWIAVLARILMGIVCACFGFLFSSSYFA